MEVDGSRFVSRIFYSELDILGPCIGNVLAFIFRNKDEDLWRFSLRFRYYEDDDLTNNSKDRKYFYDAAAKRGQGLAEILPVIRMIFQAAGAGGFEEVIVESADPAVIVQRLKEQPWAHVHQ